MGGTMALISRIGFTLFDRWGENMGRLAYTAATHTEALDGTDELKITCSRELSKGQRVVWVDRQSNAHEHLVDEVSQVHDESGKTYCEAVCINSIAELLDDYIEDKRPSGGVAEALTSIFGGTRWEVGTCDLKASASHTFYHTSVRAALTDLIATWGGELETRIETDGVKVTHRYIGVRASRGDQGSPKRFTWTKDIVDIKRTVGSANPKTRVYGYGKGVETDAGGYGRRLTFGDINGGKDYIEDAEATKVWGHPDGSGGILPAVDTYVNEQCEDAAQLLKETQDYLETVKEPTVSYEANVLDLHAYGRSWEGVTLGDCVAIIDKQFAESGIRLKGRVSQIERDLVTADTTVTFGNLVDALTDMWETVAGALKSGAASRANFDAVANPSVGWLQLLQSALNKQFNAVGTYKVESFELGQIFSNVALNPETGTPVKTTSNMWAVNINGMGIRLASSLTANGEWSWTTFITGQSVNADCINVGTMHADRVRAGLLTDEKGKNFWDFDTGEFQLSPGDVNYGDNGWTLEGVVNDLDNRASNNASDIKSLGTATGDALKELTDNLGETDKSLSELKTSINDLDGTVNNLASDGVVTEAEKAAVNKILQTIEKEQSDLSSEYSILTKSTSLNEQFKLNVLVPKYEAAFGENQAYDNLKDCIDIVLACKTADELKTAMVDYKSAYSTYASAINTYHSAAYYAKSIIEQSKAKATAQGLLSDYDDAWTQNKVFNLLTNNGKTQGVFMKNGLVYINASYMSAGIIADAAMRNSWNLKTGAFSTNYMTANNITAKGTFRCGYESYYTILNSAGQMSGYRTDNNRTRSVGYIDYSSSARDTSTGELMYGLQLQAEGIVRISSPRISTASSSNTSVTTTQGWTGHINQPLISELHDAGNGTVGWHYGTMQLRYINGILVGYSTVGTG
jgi:phage minor structural protein